MYTLADTPEIDHTWCFLLFQDGTEPGKLINDLEEFLSKIKHEGVAIGVDVMTLYSQEAEQEQVNILNNISEYFLCHSAHKHVLCPPLCSPLHMTRLNVISTVQSLSNVLNMETATPPIFQFRWVMRENPQKMLVHVGAHWTDGGSSLSKTGSKKYLQGVSRYLSLSIHAGLRGQHDLSCRIQPVEEDGVAGPAPRVQLQNARVQLQNVGRSVVSSQRGARGGVNRGRCSRGGRGGVRAGSSLNRVESGRVDSRIQISYRRVYRELERLRELRDFIVTDITRKHINVFFKNLSDFFKFYFDYFFFLSKD